MAISSWPFENADTTEGQFSQLFRELQDTGVIGSFGDASLRVSADSSGMNVKIAPGPGAIVRGFFLSSTAVETMVITPASAQPRVDRIVARLDPAADSIIPVVLPGAPAATNPQPPGLTQTDVGIWEMPLAQVTVRAGTATIGAGDVVDERPWIGHRVGIWTTAGRPAAPRRGRLGLNTSTGLWEFWTGSAWTDLAPVVTWASISGRPSTFAPSAHVHAASEIASGTLAAARLPVIPVASGGTGSTSAAAARTALGITPANIGAGTAADVATLRTDVNWINSQWPNKANVSHTHASNQVYRGAERLDVWQGAVDGSFDTLRTQVNWLNNNWGTKANAWGGEVNTVRYSPGPSAGAYGRQAGNNRYAVWMDDQLEWGRATSSLRYKDGVEPWNVDVEAVLSIEPKRFHRLVDPEGVMDHGAIAEELEAAGLTELLYYDDEGRPDAIREHHLPWALLAVIRHLRTQIDDHETRLRALEEGER